MTFMGKKRIAYAVMNRKPEWMELFGIKMLTVYLKEIRCTSVGWFVWLSVKTMNIQAP